MIGLYKKYKKFLMNVRLALDQALELFIVIVTWVGNLFLNRIQTNVVAARVELLKKIVDFQVFVP